jgi:Coenzyme PQQ synthesis protein D (PqqD)
MGSGQMNELSDHPKRRTDVNVRMVDGEVLVLDRHSDLIHQLNPTASYIWDRCDGQSSVADIAHQLAAVFDVDATMAVQDVMTTIVKLHSLGLLESVSNIPASPRV